MGVTGFAVDPHAIDEAEEIREPETIPQLLWSDLMLYIVSTPIPHINEAEMISLGY